MSWEINPNTVYDLVYDWVYRPDDFEDTYGDNFEVIAEGVEKRLASDTSLSDAAKQECLEELAIGRSYL